jgi:hypothetical protein
LSFVLAKPEGLDALLRRLVSWEAASRPASARAVREETRCHPPGHPWRSRYAELPELSLTASGHNNRGISYHSVIDATSLKISCAR